MSNIARFTVHSTNHSISRFAFLFILLIGNFDLYSQDDSNTPTVNVIDFRNPVAIVEQAGPVAWPIILCSFVSLGFILERLFALRKRSVMPGKFHRGFAIDLENGSMNRTEALERLEKNKSPMSYMLKAAVKLWGRPNREIQQAVQEEAKRQFALMKQNLRAIQSTANIAIMLGLLGTIIGMIMAFNRLSSSVNLNRSVELADGIATALLTTAMGLCVAIPSILFYTWLLSKTEKTIIAMDSKTHRIVDLICYENLSKTHRTNAESAIISSNPSKEIAKDSVLDKAS